MPVQEAKRDDNFVTTLLGVDSVGFTLPTTVAVDPTTHAMLVSASITPSGTQDVNLTKVGGAAFALGQALATASLPIVLTASQLSTLTPLATVAVTQSTSPWVVSGTVALSAGSAVIGHVIADSGSTTVVTGNVTVIQGTGTNLHVVVDSAPTTAVTGPLTDTQLRATPVPISGTTNPTTPSTMIAFVTSIPTAGSRVQLGTNTIVAGIVQAPSTNTGVVYIGGSNVSSSVYGAELQPGQASGIALDNTNKIYADTATSGNKVAFFGS